MTLVCTLRWVNGLTLLLALSMWAFAAIFQITTRFIKGAAQTGWDTAVLFGSMFQKVPARREAVPPIDLSLLLIGVALLMMFSSVFLVRFPFWMHASAVAAGGLLIYLLRPGNFELAPLVVLAPWAVYYWAAMWRVNS